MKDSVFCKEMAKQAEFALMVIEQLPVETEAETLERARGNFTRLQKEWEIEAEYCADKEKEDVANKRVPTMEEIYQAFETHCEKTDCAKCRFLTLGKLVTPDYMCAASYTHAVLTGEMTLADSFEKEADHE